MAAVPVGRRLRPAPLVVALSIILLASPPARATPEQEGAAPPASDENRQPTLKPGDTVRLRTALPAQRLEGRVDSIDDAQITVTNEEGKKLSLPWTSIDRLDLQAGRRHTYGKTVLISSGICLGVGLLIPPPKPKYCFGESCDEPLWSRQQQASAALAVGVLVGLIGEAASEPRAPRWERVHLPYQPPRVAFLGFSTSLERGGVAFQATFGRSGPGRSR
jgi:hypothetical protein